MQVGTEVRYGDVELACSLDPFLVAAALNHR
jgi:hypothetical protein